MAVETLRGIEEIGEYKVVHIESGPDDNFEELPELLKGIIEPPINKTYVVVDHSMNSLGFKLQNGPIKEVGVNGCQVNTLIEAAKIMITKRNEEFPCRENSCAITKLDEALLWLMKRKLDREKRGVEGFNQK